MRIIGKVCIGLIARLSVALSVLGFVGMSVAFGQVVLPERVVVSTRVGEDLERLPPSVTVVTGEEMERRQYTRLVEVLRQEPGLSVVSLGGVGSQSSLFVRGTNSNHTTVLLAGRRLNGGFSGLYLLENLGTAGLGRVEIQRGGGSVLYGAEGIGGVIALQPYGWEEELGRPGYLSVTGGGHSSVLLGAGQVVQEETWRAQLDGSHERTNNSLPNNEYRHTQLLPRVIWKSGERLTFDFVGLVTWSELGLPGSRDAFDFPKLEDRQETQYWLVSPGVEWRATDDITVRSFVAHSEDYLKAFNDFDGFPFFYDYWVFQDEADVQVHYDGVESYQLLGGVTYRTQRFRSDDRFAGTAETRERLTQWGVFGTAQVELPEEITLTGGIRYDEYNEFGSPVTGHIRLAKLVPEWGSGFFAQWSSSYAPPTANDLFPPFGNREIRPEKAYSGEVGWRQSWWEQRLVSTVTLFENQIRDLIEFDFDSFQGRNIGRARTRGVETSLRYAIDEDWSLFAHYTYLDARDTQNDTRLLRRPRHSYGGGIEGWVVPEVLLGVELRGAADRIDGFFEPRKIDDVTIVRVYGRWNVNERFAVFGRVENLLDRKAETAIGYREEGFRAFLGGRVAW